MSTFKHCTPSTMNKAQFIDTFRDIYEHSPWVASDTFDKGINSEHDNIDTLHSSMAATLKIASQEQQLALINAHPDLAGKAAVAGELTAASTDEQSSAGIHLCNAEEFALFNTLNTRYKEKFKFPFIMAVKNADRHQILEAFVIRIEHSTEQEFAQALLEINKIARFRLAAL